MYKRSSLASLLLLLLFSLQLQAQSLPRSVPEAEGVSSKAILDFLEATGSGKHEFHSFMFLRHGKVIAEGWWNPYAANLKHTMYSTSKSFTATAVGFAVAEKKLRLTDKVISFFPDQLPDTVSPFLAALSVKDVLTMSDGQDPDPSFVIGARDTNWVKGFLATPILFSPGSRFLYNSMGTYMLSAIVQKLTGQRIVDYLKSRLFQPLGIEGADWETDLKGINTGGWGLRVKTEDMAKFGQLFLQKGKWKGKQILPVEWVANASSLQILQHPDFSQEERDKSDWEQGYGYQMWRCRHNAFRADGAYGQFIIVMPEQDAVIAITSESPDMGGELELVWKYLLPAMQAKKLPADKKNAVLLRHTLASLAVARAPKNTASALEEKTGVKKFIIEQNQKKIQSMSFQWKDGQCYLGLQTDTASYQLAFASGTWKIGETKKLGPSLVLFAKGHFAGLPPSKIAGTYFWAAENELYLILRYIDSPHTETFKVQFDDSKLTVEISNSQDYGKNKAVLKGSLAE